LSAGEYAAQLPPDIDIVRVSHRAAIRAAPPPTMIGP
jgi:hypothetical protein